MIKIMQDKDYNKLLVLYQDYQSELYAKNNKFASSLMLNEELSREDKISLGVYNTNGDLVGFLLGYKNVLNSIYIQEQYRYYLTSLIKKYEDTLRELKYTGWVATSLTRKSAKALEHLKAVVTEIKYYKEI